MKGEVRRQISFRATVEIDLAMRSMMFETGRSQQEILEEFVGEGLRKWRESRRAGGG
jgi:hypothetical protein